MTIENINSREGTNFLRFIAIILVINSHMDVLYPISWFATGGAIGNSLFFMLSAYGLLLSEQNQSQSFTQFMVKRIAKIYPAIWINIIFLIMPLTMLYFFISPYWFAEMISEFSLNQPLTLLGAIFYPPPAHWFLQALMLFYLFGYFIIKNYNIKKILRAFVVLLVIYFTSYMQFSDYSTLVTESTLLFKVVFYAMVFLSGIYFASISDRIHYSGIVDWFVLVFLLCLIYAHKYLMLKGIMGELQFIDQLALFPFLFYCLKISKSNFVLNILMGRPAISAFITIVAAMTLELYMAHGPIRILVQQYATTFPVNCLSFLLFTGFISYGLYRLNQYLILRISN